MRSFFKRWREPVKYCPPLLNSLDSVKKLQTAPPGFVEDEVNKLLEANANELKVELLHMKTEIRGTHGIEAERLWSSIEGVIARPNAYIMR